MITKNTNRMTDGAVVNVLDFGAVGDGVTDDTAAIQAAVDVGGGLYWPAGTYLTTASISNLHTVKHSGEGAIKRGTDTFYISPTDTQTNIFYVGSTGTATNDGLSSSEPTTVTRAVSIFQSYDTQTSNGIWRIQFSSGTYSGDGALMEEFPYFKNPLEIFGADVDETTSVLPITVWQKDAVSSVPYALRMDESAYPSASIHVFVKNIKFTDWTTGGALVFWGSGLSKFYNIHTDNTRVGIWTRRNYTKVKYGKFENCSTWGVGVQYQGTLNCGDLNGGGATFINCLDGVTAGRFSVGYVQGCTFTDCTNPIDAEWASRCRVQDNTWNQGADTNQFTRLNGNSVFTDDNGAGSPNIFPVLTEEKPYIRSLSGSVNPSISKYSQKCLHAYAGSQLETGVTPVTLFPVTTTSKILLADGSYGGSDFVPLRIPAYAFFSPTFSIELEIGVSLNANAGGTLGLYGAGTSPLLTEIVIPTDASFRRGRLKLKIDNTTNSSVARYEWHFPKTGLYAEGTTSSVNNVLIRDSSDAELVYRLYWQSATTDQVEFFNLKTYITE